VNTVRIVILFSTTLLVSSVLNAQTIYESTSEEGVKEFSDQPSSGAKVIEVDPNVVDTPETPKFEPSKEPEKKEPVKATAPTSIDVKVEDDDGDFDKLRRREQRERRAHEAESRRR
jgi:hypothetical protein